MKHLTLILFFGFIFLLSCNDQNESEGIQMYFIETQCGDVWGILKKSEDLSIIKNYLEKQDVFTYGISREDYDVNGIHCNACSCPSGWIIIIRIPESDIEKAKEIGFTRTISINQA